MNRTDICKNIIQSIKEYITTPEKLEPHCAKNHFIRKRKLSLFQVIMYLLYTSKASMFQNLSRIREDLGSLDFPDISKKNSKFDFELGNSILEPSMANK